MTAKKCLLWLYMFSKRLLLRWSFVIILLSMPVAVWGMQCVMTGDGGLLTVYLCTESDDGSAGEVIEYIENSKTSLSFKRSHNLEDSLKALKQKDADAVWYFEDGFSKKADFAAEKELNPLVRVFEREDTTPLKLSREKLFSGIHKTLSYSMYKNFVCTELLKDGEISDEIIKSYAQKRDSDKELVNMEPLLAGNEKESMAYLVMPIRGMLSLFVVIGGLAAAVVYLDDCKNGRLCLFSAKKQMLPAFAQCFSGAFLAGMCALVTLRFSPLWLGLIKEGVAMFLFSIAVSGLCLAFCQVFKSPLKLASFIPAITVVMLFLSPIFFDATIFTGVKIVLPTHYYLRCIYDKRYILMLLIYIACVFLISYIYNIIIHKKEVIL